MFGRADRRHRFAGSLCGLQKKSTGQYSAAGAALGGRTLKTGQSRCFVGDKKHTLRLWLHHCRVGVLLVPLVSWVTPANVSEGGLLVPSLHYCQRQWDWCPPLIVADMGYLAAEAKRRRRERWPVAVLTKLRSDMKLVPPYVAWHQAACQLRRTAGVVRLRWLGSRNIGSARAPLRNCAGDVGKLHAAHDSLPIDPSSTRRCSDCCPWPVRRHSECCRKCALGLSRRSPTRKKQLGLGKVFLNGLRFAWARSLLAGAAILLRARLDAGASDSAIAVGRTHADSTFVGVADGTLRNDFSRDKLESAKSTIKSGLLDSAFATPSNSKISRNFHFKQS